MFEKLNCKEAKCKDLMMQCEENLADSDLHLPHNSQANLETNLSHVVGGYYDLQSRCVIYNPTIIANYGLFRK